LNNNSVLIEDLLKYKFISKIKIGPDNNHVVFIVKQASRDQNGYDANLYLFNLKDYQIKQLTFSGKVRYFLWNNQDNEILFIESKEDKEQGSPLYRISITDKGSDKICTLPRKVESLDIINKDTLIYTARVDISKYNGVDKGDCQVLDEIPFWKNDIGFINKCRVHLFLYNIQNMNEEELVQGFHDVISYDYRKDRVVYISREFRHKANQVNQLWLLNLSTRNSICLSRDEYLIERVHFLDNETVLILATDMKKYGIRQSREVYIYNINTKQVKNLTSGWDRMIGNYVTTDCCLENGPITRIQDSKLYILITERDSCYLDRIDDRGQIKRLVSTTGSVDSFDVRGNKIIFVALREGQLQEIYLLEKGKEIQLTSLNREIIGNRDICIPEYFFFTAEDGTKIDSWVMKPAGFSNKKSYPALLMIHGGPKTVYGSVFFHEMQVLTGKGYVIFYCNPRGSAGLGDAFADMQDNYGVIDYGDLMTLVDYIIENISYVDRGRLGVMGGSYGGFLTNWIVGHSSIFKAACSQRAIANWISKFCSTDTGYYINADRGTPWDEDKGEKLWWHSPLRYADKVKTPLLLIHSEEDYDVTFLESMQMFTALRYHGVESRLVLFFGENHNLSRTGKPRNRIRRLQEILSWFDHYLKK
jgi:dipeptidyl aminopeptidase/acylaminoacyl peptidase